MTDLAVIDRSQPRAEAAPSTPARLWAVVLLWLERARQRDALSELDERLLRDIGVSPAEAMAEVKKPVWIE